MGGCLVLGGEDNTSKENSLYLFTILSNVSIEKVAGKKRTNGSTLPEFFGQ